LVALLVPKALGFCARNAQLRCAAARGRL